MASAETLSDAAGQNVYDTVTKPESEVPHATGFAGFAALAWTLVFVFVRQTDLNPALKTLELLVAPAAAMIVFDFIRTKAYRNVRNPVRFFHIQNSPVSQLTIAGTRVLGMIVLAGSFAILYALALRLFSYFKIQFAFFAYTLVQSAPIIFGILLAYIVLGVLLNLHTKDFFWHLGRLALRKEKFHDIPHWQEQMRQWALKAFFVPFMLGLVYGNVVFFQHILGNYRFDVLQSFLLLHGLVFITDTVFGTIGYIASFHWLGSHIRSTQRSFLGWAVCLICYPPLLFVLQSLAYFEDTPTWDKWLLQAGFLAWTWAGTILFFEILYVWATVIYGLRFSNLTNRGIVTNGPYHYFKHPAYLAKNIAWWLIYMPFMPAFPLGLVLVNSAQLFFVNFVYFLRAKTEERHLMEDERYRAYVRWIDTHGVLPRIRQILTKTAMGRLLYSVQEDFCAAINRLYQRWMPMSAQEFVQRLW